VPVYEYHCKQCGHRFELRQGFDSEPAAPCPECKEIANRQISLVPVIFKGSGWYVTDYARRNSTLSDESVDSSAQPDKKQADKKQADKKQESSTTESTPSEKPEGTVTATPKEE
jgi:putative FmdB family regulatory protein